MPGACAARPRSKASDFTSRTVLTDLPPGQRIFYRVLFQDLSDLRTWSEPVTGSFTTPSPVPRDVTVAWSADTVGQGWGINPEWGGLRLYETMRQAQPDVFINLGDTIYADRPLLPEVKLDNGTMWKNVVTDAKSKVAETLDEYRGCYQYNLADDHMRRFIAEVPQIVMWDDHEVLDNWYWERRQDGDARYKEKSVALLAARARQALFEYNPLPLGRRRSGARLPLVPLGPLVEVFALDMRSYKGANSAESPADDGRRRRFSGAAQLEWLKARCARARRPGRSLPRICRSAWSSRDGPDIYEAVANGDRAAARARAGVADLLRDSSATRVRNVVWITADVHYCAAHHDDPSRAKFTEFDPFWEFVAGPLHAGTFGPNALDKTFGPEVGSRQSRRGEGQPPADGGAPVLRHDAGRRQDARASPCSCATSPDKTLYSVELPAES